MKRYELSLSENYVSHWGVKEAIRELLQNAIDQEKIDPSNELYYEFGETSIAIGNKKSELRVESLLLGESTKRDDRSTIGKFGEGYKLALLVLCRLGKSVRINNYAAKEHWSAKLRKSPKYNDVRVLTVEVTSNWFWETVPDCNLTYLINGLTEDEIDEIKESCLLFHGTIDSLQTSRGLILLDERYSGKIYVCGLYVTTIDGLQYGYSFNADQIPLDRDRTMVKTFDVQWMTSQMWQETGSELIQPMLLANNMDIKHIEHTYGYVVQNKMQDVAERSYAAFKATHGDKALPVADQQEYEQILRQRGGATNVKPVITNAAYTTVLKRSDQYRCDVYEKIPPVKQPTPFEILCKFRDNYVAFLDDNVQDEFDRIVDASVYWKNSD